MDESSILQRLVKNGTISMEQARWVEAQASGGFEGVQEILLRFGLARTEDLESTMEATPVPSLNLVAVAAGQARCDRIMRVIFELCVQRGVIDYDEYLARLAEDGVGPEDGSEERG